MESMCYTYILKCSDGTYYTGWTNDLDKRLKAHNGGKSGAKYTRNRRPVTLVYYEKFQDKQEAMKREYAIKQLTRREKELPQKENAIRQTKAGIMYRKETVIPAFSGCFKCSVRK